MKLNAVVVEDEELSMQHILSLLDNHKDIIEVKDTARHCEEAIEKINEHNPDIVFLDIRIPGGDGFKVLDSIDNIPFVVFITAYNEYALKAFDNNSLDYLLKPITAERLDQTIEKIDKIFSLKGKTAENSEETIEPLVEQKSKLKTLIESQLKKIPIKTMDGYELLKLDDILYIKANNKFAEIHTTDDCIKTDYSLNKIEEKYPDTLLRIHRNTLVNVNKIERLEKWVKGTYIVIMTDGSDHEISKRKMSMMHQLFSF